MDVAVAVGTLLAWFLYFRTEGRRGTLGLAAWLRGRWTPRRACLRPLFDYCKRFRFLVVRAE